MMRKIRITVGLMTVVFGLSAPVVFADNGNSGNLGQGQATVAASQPSSNQGDHEGKKESCKKSGNCPMKGKTFHKLNLTDDQKKQLKAVELKKHETMKATFEQVKANREALNKELLQATPDLNKVNDLQAQLKTLQGQIADNHLSSILEVKKILTPEQFSKYLELEKQKFGDHSRWGKEEKNDCGCEKGKHCKLHKRHHREDGNQEHHKHLDHDEDSND